MLHHLILSVLSDDKPGVVEAIAQAINKQDGNWLESHLAQLGGKFAGVIHVGVHAERSEDLRAQLEALSKKSIQVSVEQVSEGNLNTNTETATFSAIGPDRPGIIKELSTAFAQRHINLTELETRLSSAPYSGEPLFEATGELALPSSLDMDDLEEQLDDIANSLALDVNLTPSP